MLWYIKYIYESSAIGFCFLGFNMVVFNALVKTAKKFLALSFKKTSGRNYKTVSNETTDDHQTCSCQWHSVPGWQIILLTLPWLPYKNTVTSAALLSCTYCTALECQGRTHMALQRRCPCPSHAHGMAGKQVSRVQILTETPKNTVLLQCSRKTLLLGQSTNQNVMLRKITSSCTLI